MNTVNFHTIRTVRGSANNGFEELCCQLAEAEPSPPNSRFVRNGTPDGGVEAYRILPDESEHGWQAKYFFEIGASQWRQLKDSIETALSTHAKLTRYTICLPIDLPDARQKEKKSLRDKWNDQVKGWERFAAQLNMSVEFDLWGEHELHSRLSRDAHAGRRWYWFNETELSSGWFQSHLREAVAGAGPRYNTAFTVDLPIMRKFEALGYTESFRSEWNVRRSELLERSKQVLILLNQLEGAEHTREKEAFRQAAHDLISRLESFGESLNSQPEFFQLDRFLTTFSDAALDLYHGLSGVFSKRQQFGDTQSLESTISVLRSCRTAINNLIDFFDSYSAELASRPAMLLAGEAGSGKTHLLCDIAKHRIEAGLPTLILLGQQFDRGDIWQQLLARLGLSCTRDELLGALDSVSQATGGRTLIFIDAINEAINCRWLDTLPRFLEVISRYRRLGIAVSCRSTYEEYLVRKDLLSSRLSRILHEGFAPRLFDAIKMFCTHYQIEILNTPPLDPEFANPLFLKLFCQGLHDSGLRRPPKGHHGLQRIFAFLIDSVNSKLHHLSELDYAEETRVVHQAVNAVADAMVESGVTSLPIQKAQVILETIHPGSGLGYSNSLLKKLIAEGILANDLRYSLDREEPEPVVRFGYERLSDFQIARRLLDRHLAPQSGEPENAFAEGSPLWSSLQVKPLNYRSQGILAAFIVLVPERLGRELSELLPNVAEQYGYRHAFLEALPWRDGKHIGPIAIQTVERFLDDGDHGSGYHATSDGALDRVIQLTGLPDHPLNARWLHTRLLSLTMPERDYRWSTYLHRNWSKQNQDSSSVVDRLLDWAWPDDPSESDLNAGCDDEVIELAAIAVTWCFTTANRFVRDKATKALACLLRRRLHLVPSILEAFRTVNDLYVSERLYGAVFGAVVRGCEAKFVRPIALAAYDHNFAIGRHPVHILLRDYAREIIEYAASIGCAFDFNLDEIRPPYQSEPPSADSRTWDDLREIYKQDGYGTLLLSLMPDHGDFVRYVMQYYSSELHAWVSTANPYERVRQLEKEHVELPNELARRWRETKVLARSKQFDAREVKNEDVAESVMNGGIEEALSQTELLEDSGEDDDLSKILALFSPGELDTIERYEEAKSRLKEAEDEAEDLLRRQYFDADQLCCWVLERVMDLGWKPELFAEFDNHVNRHNMREAQKPERIGKKYQWIAYHELAARVTDQRPYLHRSSSESLRYQGPWQCSFRDIDPTALMKVDTKKQSTSCWWIPLADPLPLGATLDDPEWLRHAPSLPDLSSIISVSKPGDTTRWLNLQSYLTWDDKARTEDSTDRSRRVTSCIGTIIVRRTDFASILSDLAKVEWTGSEVSCPDFHEQFFGEYFWGPSFEGLRRDAALELSDFTEIESTQTCTLRSDGVRAARPVLQYEFSSGFDCSAEEPARGYVPSVWLSSRMGLYWTKVRCRFNDGRDHLIAFDPSHEEPGVAALLIEQTALEKFLQEHDLTMLWLIIGEKMLLGGKDYGPDSYSGPRIAVYRQAYELSAGLGKPLRRTFGPLGTPGEEY